MQDRVDQIVAAYYAGLVSGDEARMLLSDPNRSLPQQVATNQAYNIRRGSPAEDVPYVFSFTNYRRFLAPVRFGKPNRPFVLPVTPEEVQIGLGNTATTITTIGGRTYSHAIGVDLEKISFSGYLPTIVGTPSSLITPTFDPGTMGNAGRIAFKFKQAMHANQPLIFAVTKLSPTEDDGDVVSPIAVTITNFTRTVKHGHGSDIFYEMELQRWYPQHLRVGTSRASNSSPPSNNGTKPKTRKHKTKTGDTLANIAYSQLGDISRWRQIYRLNKKRIDSGKLWAVSGGATKVGLIRKLRPDIILLIPKE